ncbi:hypothetical protein CCR75_004758 [Bremia lactucae]|uniref:Uncharacterized protein n=1 Tax=Bremia lactucae TaxID=4779 RepID=A0A976FLG3_BRELC|nr:hypothetical protein CCR75_008675 [Bremia lactucae]TDH69037.1 hypothetical protein CCR75_004758 [Bremia lactucae]
MLSHLSTIDGVEADSTLNWPFAVEEIKEHSCLIKNILTGSLYNVPGSRMKRFSGNYLGVTDELREHVVNQGLVLGDRSIDDPRYNKAADVLKLKGQLSGTRRRRRVIVGTAIINASRCSSPGRAVSQQQCAETRSGEVPSKARLAQASVEPRCRSLGRNVLRIVPSATSRVASCYSFELKELAKRYDLS